MMYCLVIFLICSNIIKPQNIEDERPIPVSARCALKPTVIFNAKKVMKTLWQLPLDEFDQAWHYTVDAYSVFNKELIRSGNCIKFVQLCRMLHNFFTHLFVDTQTNSLMYVLGALPFGIDKNRIHSLHTHWKLTHQMAYQHFYAVYFDCVVSLFINTIYAAHLHRDTQEWFDDVSRAQRYCSELYTIHKLLVGGEYEKRYARQLVRYQEVIALLRAATE